MKRIQFVGLVLGILITTNTGAQRTNIKEQEKVMSDFRGEHTSRDGRGHTVTTDRAGTFTETWTSPNGDKNTYAKDKDGKVTTTIEHPDGSKTVNGVTTESNNTSRSPNNVAESKGSTNESGTNGSGGGNAGNSNNENSERKTEMRDVHWDNKGR